ITMPEPSPATVAYETELQARQSKVDEFLALKRTELLAGLRSRAADYLLAAHNAERRPGEEAYPLLLPGELNPRIRQRWRAFLKTTGASHHPVLAPWHAFAALPQKDFSAQAPAVAERVAANADPDKPINVLVARAFAERPPVSLREVAQRYGVLFERIDKLWRATHEEQADGLEALPDASQEAIRQVLYGADSPYNMTSSELDRMLDRPVRNKLTELQRQVDEWQATAPGAPPRAMGLHDTPRPVPPPAFGRGNPNNPGPPVPRQFLQVLAGDARKPFTKGSGRLELAQAIASPDNPLTARVMVNRIWLHHFGAGLVRTPSDF